MINRKPAYQNQEDKSKWLCWVSKNKEWWINTKSTRGRPSGFAHTTAGDSPCPWDPDASWREYDTKDEEWQEATTRQHPDSVFLFGLPTGSGQYKMTEEEVNDHPAYVGVADDSKWLCYCEEKACWYIQSESSKGEGKGWAYTYSGINSSPWDPDATWRVYDDEEWQVLDQGTVAPYPSSITFSGLQRDKLNGTYNIAEEKVNDKVCYVNDNEFGKMLCWNDDSGIWMIQSASNKGDDTCNAKTTKGPFSTPWMVADCEWKEWAPGDDEWEWVEHQPLEDTVCE